jgi:glycosyltransferase involved in cell wall biosynthesis
MKIWAHTLVKNEERFVWYSVSSIVNYVDKILLWDTGSTDNTVSILKELKKKYPEKIELNLLGSVTSDEFTKVREDMLKITKSDWFIVSDADEIWWSDSIRNLTKTILDKGTNIESIYTPAVLLVGDMFHFQEERAGKYNIGGKRGHFGLKAVNRNIPGLSSLKPHGQWGWVDGDNRMIQERDPDKLLFVDAPFMHASFLQRSKNRILDSKVPKRDKKYKIELGSEFPLDYFYPEVFFEPRPNFVNSIWNTIDFKYRVKASVLTPLKKIKRRLI